ncbi:deubiquitination module subunit SGF73 SCDLUD_001105 [Saccharomycodes ludwigii]|uniref:deubiquitination module subunit SGF73 n=1 Tax=Saccharomycodes ludwigii TaxID=36035 RepID=UPI001E876AB8|nr:hypothetical protein SCDLUD_001105 [Saccharomycodes ludwigii]KAH3903465.1 hypothetical protein SCDLUD_001105 [Saccharomycodes ludwigii]
MTLSDTVANQVIASVKESSPLPLPQKPTDDNTNKKVAPGWHNLNLIVKQNQQQEKPQGEEHDTDTNNWKQQLFNPNTTILDNPIENGLEYRVCNKCGKPISLNVIAQHIENNCGPIPINLPASTGTTDTATSNDKTSTEKVKDHNTTGKRQRLKTEHESTKSSATDPPTSPPKKKRTKNKAIVTDGIIDLDKQCGAELPNNMGQCGRSLTCKTHSMGAKRGVIGRSKPFDILLAQYQKDNKLKITVGAATKAQLEQEENGIVVSTTDNGNSNSNADNEDATANLLKNKSTRKYTKTKNADATTAVKKGNPGRKPKDPSIKRKTAEEKQLLKKQKQQLKKQQHLLKQQEKKRVKQQQKLLQKQQQQLLKQQQQKQQQLQQQKHILTTDEETNMVLNGISRSLPLPLENYVLTSTRIRTKNFRMRQMFGSAFNIKPGYSKPGFGQINGRVGLLDIDKTFDYTFRIKTPQLLNIPSSMNNTSPNITNNNNTSGNTNINGVNANGANNNNNSNISTLPMTVVNSNNINNTNMNMANLSPQQIQILQQKKIKNAQLGQQQPQNVPTTSKNNGASPLSQQAKVESFINYNNTNTNTLTTTTTTTTTTNNNNTKGNADKLNNTVATTDSNVPNVSVNSNSNKNNSLTSVDSSLKMGTAINSPPLNNMAAPTAPITDNNTNNHNNSNNVGTPVNIGIKSPFTHTPK